MDESVKKMFAQSEKNCVEIKEMKIPIDVILGGEEVRLNFYMTFIHNLVVYR